MIFGKTSEIIAGDSPFLSNFVVINGRNYLFGTKWKMKRQWMLH